MDDVNLLVEVLLPATLLLIMFGLAAVDGRLLARRSAPAPQQRP